MPYKDKKKQLACQRKAYKKKKLINPSYQKQRVQIYRNNHPWLSSYSCAKARCTNSNNTHYKYYGGRGIIFLLTVNEVKELWYRDKAYEMKKPSIDRIDNNGNYTYENCRFIEFNENASRNHKNCGKRIFQFDLEGNFIREWNFAKRVSDRLGILLTCITACARGEQKTSGGFIWRYENETQN